MESYQIWFLRRNGEIIGSFPDAVIAQQMVLGRVRKGDEVSVDTHSWHQPADVPSLQQAVNALIGVQGGQLTGDPEWRTERMRAAIRWLDERKTPDRRSTEEAEAAARWAALRTNKDRRINPEPPELIEYRKQRAIIEQSLRRPRRNYNVPIFIIVLLIIGVIIACIYSDPVQPYHIHWEALIDK